MIKWLIRTLFRAVGQVRIQPWARHQSTPSPTKPVSGSSVESCGECRHLGSGGRAEGEWFGHRGHV